MISWFKLKQYKIENWSYSDGWKHQKNSDISSVNLSCPFSWHNRLAQCTTQDFKGLLSSNPGMGGGGVGLTFYESRQ
jgi:hypothetical protein